MNLKIIFYLISLLKLHEKAENPKFSPNMFYNIQIEFSKMQKVQKN